MSEKLCLTLPLQHWQGERGTYRLVTIAGQAAEALAGHALLHRLEFGTRRGFGSVKVVARIGGTQWKTSVFPQNAKAEWILLISKKVIRAEDLVDGHPVMLELKLL